MELDERTSLEANPAAAETDSASGDSAGQTGTPQTSQRTSSSTLDAECFEEIISRYELTVFSLAMHLTGDLSAAAQVVEEVFLRISRLPDYSADEDMETLIHRCTYDSALSHLLRSKAVQTQ